MKLYKDREALFPLHLAGCRVSTDQDAKCLRSLTIIFKLIKISYFLQPSETIVDEPDVVGVQSRYICMHVDKDDN